jgi:hypothetical protein
MKHCDALLSELTRAENHKAAIAGYGPLQHDEAT